jgi:hypothetical protein
MSSTHAGLSGSDTLAEVFFGGKMATHHMGHGGGLFGAANYKQVQAHRAVFNSGIMAAMKSNFT